MMKAVAQTETESSAELGAPQAGPRRWPASWSEIQWPLLVVVTLLCFVLSRQDGLRPAVGGAILLASAISSIAGFAFSAICGAMLFHLSKDPVWVVQIMIVCSIANQAAMVWALRRTICWPELAILLIGGIAGLPVGMAVLLTLDHHVYTHVLGAFLLAYGVYMLVRKPLVIRRQSVALDLLSGFLGGITGGAVGFPGAFVTIWVGFKGWSKERQRAMFQPFILIMQVAALLAISLVRHSTGRMGFDPVDLFYVPAGLLGTTLGMALYARLSDRHFTRAVNVLMVVSGASYLG
jgi:uncharacterized protein